MGSGGWLRGDTMGRPALTETLKHKKLLETFYDLGENRTLEQLAKVSGISRATLGRYKKEFDWPRQLYEIEARIRDKVDEFSIVKKGDAIAQLSDWCFETLFRVFTDIREGKSSIEVKSMADVQRLTDMYLKLRGFVGSDGQPKDNGQVASLSVVLKSSGEDAPNALRQIVAALSSPGLPGSVGSDRPPPLPSTLPTRPKAPSALQDGQERPPESPPPPKPPTEEEKLDAEIAEVLEDVDEEMQEILAAVEEEEERDGATLGETL